MGYKRQNKRKRIMIAYALRALVVLMAAGMIALMICGCMYIMEGFGENDDTAVSGVHGTSVNGEKTDDSGGSAGWTDQTAETGSSPTQNDESTGEDGDISEEKDKCGKYSDLSIVLDAGHGGNDGGTLSGDVIEKDITLTMVLLMEELLEEEGVKVILTRDSDVKMSLEDRAELANEADADLFVSIHCNYYEDDATVNGLECYYYENSEIGQRYAESIIDELEEQSSTNIRSAREGDFYVLRETDIPAVLIEIGFLSNKQECKQLASEAYQKQLAEDLVESILESLGTDGRE